MSSMCSNQAACSVDYFSAHSHRTAHADQQLLEAPDRVLDAAGANGIESAEHSVVDSGANFKVRMKRTYTAVNGQSMILC